MKMLGRRFYRTMFGLAQVFDGKAPDGSPVRILKVGGVFQSATYLDERRFEPVFEYYRAFDAAFRAPAFSNDGETCAPPQGDDEPTPDADGLRFAPGRARGRSGGTRPSMRRILMIGGGGYAWPKHVLATRFGVRLDVVEIDPAIAEIARRHFFVDEAVERFCRNGLNRLETICADGREFLERAARGCGGRNAGSGARLATLDADPAERGVGGGPRIEALDAPETEAEAAFGPYDAIVNDAFSGIEPVRSLASVEAAKLAKSILAPGGLYLMNVVSESGGADLSFLRDMAATLLQAFGNVHIVPCPDEDFGGEDNYLVIATDGMYAFEGAIPFDEGFLGNPIFD